MNEQQEQNLHEIDLSLEATIEWMRKRQPGDWARVHVPGEPHRYGTMHLYLLLRIEALLREMKTLLEEQRQPRRTRRKTGEQAHD